MTIRSDAADEPAIRFENVQFRYPGGDFALDVPRLEIAPGERVALIGPSGAGKTTLLHLAAGIVTPDRGSVRIGGEEIGRLGDAQRRDFRSRRIGLVFQEFELLEYLSVLDNVLLPYRVSAALALEPQVRERALALAREVGIGDKAERLPAQLSHGERQRAALCRALVVEPTLVLADEPTGNLDPANKDRVLALLLDFASRSGAALLTVTHDHGLLDRFDRVIDFEVLGTAA